MRLSPARTALPVTAGLALAAVGYALAERVIPRLSDHRGFFLIAHDDRVDVPLARRPRRAVVVVVDGLRQDEARRLGSVARVRTAGRCAVADVGLPSVSRPVYAVISSGVEQARTGSRNNDTDTPLAVDSIWERARAASLRVTYRSELPWWGQLFPGGFDGATVLPTSRDLFAAPFTDDLTPTLAVLLGVPIPHHAGVRRSPRATVEAVVDCDVVGAPYLDGRLRGHARVARLGGDWAARDAGERRKQRLRGGLALVLHRRGQASARALRDGGSPGPFGRPR